jgi:hypothetical protein
MSGWHVKFYKFTAENLLVTENVPVFWEVLLGMQSANTLTQRKIFTLISIFHENASRFINSFIQSSVLRQAHTSYKVSSPDSAI